MDDGDSPNTAPKPRGCLKLACGGLLALVLVLAVAAYLLWRHLSGWGAGEFAWEKMPAATRWAVEASDIHRLMTHGIDDQGIVSLLRRGLRHWENDLAGRDPLYKPSQNAEGIIDLYRQYGFLHPLLAPNSILFGKTDDGSLFAMVRAPVWTRHAPARFEAEMRDVVGAQFHITFIDDWFCLSTSEAVLREITDNWHAPAKPLGATLRQDGARIVFGATRQPEPAAAPGGALFLDDPFAGRGRAAAGRPRTLVTLLPKSGGWLAAGIWEEAVETAGGQTLDASQIGKAAPAPDLGVYDVQARAAIPLPMLEKRLPVRSAEWLRPLLDQAGGEYVLTAEKPVVKDRELAPLPVFTLGWSLKPGIGAHEANRVFTERIESMVERGTASLHEGLLREAARNSLRVASEMDGMGGMLRLPPVAANGALPAWRFTETAGWLATDPAGLDNAGELPHRFNNSQVNELQIESGWDMSEAFRTALHEAIRERLEMLPNDTMPNKREALAGASLVNEFLGFYPKGALILTGDEKSARFGLAIPFGQFAP